MQHIKGALFDLDGVLVDTAKYHYLAWKRLAADLGFDFSKDDNQRLKGVSRVRSLEILLEIGGIQADEKQKNNWAEQKNTWYVEYLNELDNSALLPGSVEYLNQLSSQGVLIALGSASKNATMILERLHIIPYFDAIIDGNSVQNAKPDPEVFLKGAQSLNLSPKDCAVYEDSLAGVQAAKAGGMYAVGVGNPKEIPGADIYIAHLGDLVT